MRSFTVIKLVEYIDGIFADIGIQLCCFDKTCFAKENSTTVRFREIAGLPNIQCNYNSFYEPIGKIIFCTDVESELLAVEKALKSHEMSDRFDYIRSERSLFEILPKGANKGLALKKLAEHLGVNMPKTIAIGDYDNDASMLSTAGLGIAVANASQAALDAADVVTVSNEEDAIAKVIYDLECGAIF